MTDSPRYDQDITPEEQQLAADRAISDSDISTADQLVWLLTDVEGATEIGVCVDINGHNHYTLDVGAFEVRADSDSINLVVGRYANGTQVIVIQGEDGDGDPPRSPYEAMVIGYDISAGRYILRVPGEERIYSEPEGTVHSLPDLILPTVRASVCDWNAKVRIEGHSWIADCEASRGMSYRGFWRVSEENYGVPVIVRTLREG